jgi:hypothetical protein
MIDPKNLDISTLPSVNLESRTFLPPLPSVYLAVDAQSKVQYIGRSLNTKTRWAKHSKLKDLMPLGSIKIYYLLLPENVLVFVENVLIEYFKPPLNFIKQSVVGIKVKELTPHQIARQGIHRNSCDRYTRFALEYASNNFSAPDRFLGIAEQQTIIIYDLLQDGEWHTAKEIGCELSLGKRTVQNIMQAISNPLSITNSHLGYCIIKKCLEND